MFRVEAGGHRETDKIIRWQGRVLLYGTGYRYCSPTVEVRKSSKLFREGECFSRLSIYDRTLDGQWKGETILMRVYEQIQENGMDLAWVLVFYCCHDELTKIE